MIFWAAIYTVISLSAFLYVKYVVCKDQILMYGQYAGGHNKDSIYHKFLPFYRADV